MCLSSDNPIIRTSRDRRAVGEERGVTAEAGQGPLGASVVSEQGSFHRIIKRIPVAHSADGRSLRLETSGLGPAFLYAPE